MRSKISVTAKGKTKSLTEWAKETGLSYQKIYVLHQKGLLVQFLETGVMPKKKVIKYPVSPGDQIGYLTILEETDLRTSNGTVIFRCQCVCGKEKLYPKSSLVGEHHVSSCGCMQYKTVSEKLTKDLTGMTFGLVTVKRRAGMKGRYAAWEVEAPNGKTAIVSSQQLLQGGYTGQQIATLKAPQTRLGRIYTKYFKDQYEFQEWEEFEKWAIDAGYNEYSELCRHDEEKPYTKDNAFFRQKKTFVTINGVTKNLTGWAEQIGLTRERARQLNNEGRLEEYVLSGKPTPKQKGKLIADSKIETNRNNILEFLKTPHTDAEILEESGFRDMSYFRSKYIAPLLSENLIHGEATAIQTESGRKIITILYQVSTEQESKKNA